MKLSWVFNGTLQAHHLAGVYLTVWLIQGGYIGWVVWQTMRARKNSKQSAPNVPTTRDRF
jgi:threonine/homoserine/homoserine lactone efflux protein